MKTLMWTPKSALEIEAMLKQGQSLKVWQNNILMIKFSGKGGQLNPFTKGELRSIEFEEAAYSLNEIGAFLPRWRRVLVGI